MPHTTSTVRIIKTYSTSEETFWRGLVFPVEEHEVSRLRGGYRWFRAPNVLCIEHYRRPIEPPQPDRQKVGG
jgi:hypothetical protein